MRSKRKVNHEVAVKVVAKFEGQAVAEAVPEAVAEAVVQAEVKAEVRAMVHVELMVVRTMHPCLLKSHLTCLPETLMQCRVCRARMTTRMCM